MNHGFNAWRSLTFSAMLLASTAAFALPPVVVKTYGQHVGGNIVYTQEVSNSGDREVMKISIGYDTDYVGADLPYTRTSGELTIFPIGSDVYHMEIKPGSVSGPSGWTAQLIQIEHSGQYLIWRSPAYPEPAIAPGLSASFRVVVPKYDAVYVTGHFSAGYADGKAPWAFNGVMEKLDTTPPVLSVTAAPATIWPPNNKLVPVTITVSAKDDYDPQPEIKLESITSNESLTSGDIQGAALGTDDRSFSLMATRSGTNTAGRTYTITYSATDGTGNKSTATTTVTVPHDQGK